MQDARCKRCLGSVCTLHFAFCILNFGVHKMRTPVRAFLIALAFIAILLPTAGVSQQITTGGPRRGYTPAPGAKDLKAVLFNWYWHMGMLRGAQEIEAVATLEHTATGTIQVDGQPCKLAKYRVSTNYQVGGQRVQYTCARPNGQEYSAIEVVNGQFAWNEDIMGAEIVPGKGKATPKPGAVAERLIRLWASPQGAPKAATAATQRSATIPTSSGNSSSSSSESVRSARPSASP